MLKAKKAIIVSVAKACNYHARAIKHVRHLLPESVAQTLACSLINISRPSTSFKERRTTQLVWYWQQSVTLMPSRSYASSTGYSTAAHSIQGGGSDAQSSYDRCSYSYLSQHLVQHVATRQTRSTALPLLTDYS